MRSCGALGDGIDVHEVEFTAGSKETTMLFMVVERFKPGTIPDIYRRLRDEGRSLPDGLTYEGSWIEAGFGRCFQLMACDDAPAPAVGIELGRPLRSRDRPGRTIGGDARSR